MIITGKTQLTGLLGSPVAHSISPMMHNEAFCQLDLDYAYLAFTVSENDLEAAIQGLKALHVRGFNLTMPHKNKACELVDCLSPAAQMVGAINTVVNDQGKLTGHTTDGVGYMRALRDAGHDILGEKLTMLGAGGAATAICVQAALDGVREIDIFSRKKSFVARTEKMVTDINEGTNCTAHFYDLSDKIQLRRSIAESALLINGTPVGMAPHQNETILPDETLFHPALVVSDLIYNPTETAFLRMARKRGCQTFNGLYMLLYQGAEAFSLWTGKEMPVETIKELYFKQ